MRRWTKDACVDARCRSLYQLISARYFAVRFGTFGKCIQLHIGLALLLSYAYVLDFRLTHYIYTRTTMIHEHTWIAGTSLYLSIADSNIVRPPRRWISNDASQVAASEASPQHPYSCTFRWAGYRSMAEIILLTPLCFHICRRTSPC